jgi:ketosteroid isomerase-like protein
MEKILSVKQLLDIYYSGFAEKANWESVIAEDFQYTGGDMTNTGSVVGKQAYIDIIKRFSQRFTAMRVQDMLIDGNKACVTGNYDFIFPNGKKINGNVSEHWTVKDGQLHSLTLYFDTLTFMTNLR